MKIYVITCTFNISQTLIDCAFQKAADAEAYISELNGDKTKAVARCKELIVLRDSESMIQYLVEEELIKFDIIAIELKNSSGKM